MDDCTDDGLVDKYHYDHQNHDQIFTGKLRSHRAYDSIRMDIPVMVNKGYSLFLRRSG